MSLPEEEFRCPVCLETVVNAVVCSQCDQHFCEGHSVQFDKCPTCRAAPFLTVPNSKLRKLVDRVRVKCHFCGSEIPRGEMPVHQKFCQPRRCCAARCRFETSDRKAAMTHIVSEYEEILWEDFSTFSNGVFIQFDLSE